MLRESEKKEPCSRNSFNRHFFRPCLGACPDCCSSQALTRFIMESIFSLSPKLEREIFFHCWCYFFVFGCCWGDTHFRIREFGVRSFTKEKKRNKKGSLSLSPAMNSNGPVLISFLSFYRILFDFSMGRYARPLIIAACNNGNPNNETGSAIPF